MASQDADTEKRLEQLECSVREVLQTLVEKKKASSEVQAPGSAASMAKTLLDQLIRLEKDTHRVRSDLGNWIEEVQWFSSQGYVDEATDILFDRMDQMFEEGRFSEVDNILQSLDPAAFGSHLIVGWLCCTKVAWQHLPSRPAFVDRAEKWLDATMKDHADLLKELR